MIRCDTTVDVARTPGDVFSFLDDFARAPSWMAACRELAPTTLEPHHVGTKLRYTYAQGSRLGAMDGVVSERDPPRRLAMRFADKMFEVDIAYTIESSGAGTRVELVREIVPRKLAAKLMSPMIRAAARKQVAADAAKLKQALEGR
jgi:carbon monoxide dehydrogenase subunit G